MPEGRPFGFHISQLDIHVTFPDFMAGLYKAKSSGSKFHGMEMPRLDVGAIVKFNGFL